MFLQLNFHWNPFIARYRSLASVAVLSINILAMIEVFTLMPSFINLATFPQRYLQGKLVSYGEKLCSISLSILFYLWFLNVITILQHQTGNSRPVSQRFGHLHSQIPSVLGIPFSYYCSILGIPRYPPGMPKSLVFWSSPPKKILDFAGKSKTFQRWIPLNIEIFSSILKIRLPGRLQKARQNDSSKIRQKVRV